MNKTNYIEDIEYSRPAKEKFPSEIRNGLYTLDINGKK